MSPRISLPFSVVLPVVLTVALCSCTAPAAEVSGTSIPAPSPTTVAEPSAEPTLSPADKDAVMFVRATATADNGSQLDLEMQVHQSYAFDYGGIPTLIAGVIDDCQGAVTEPMIAQGQWSFVRANVSALPVGSTPEWPAGAGIVLAPSGKYAYSAARGIVTASPAPGDILCSQDKLFSGSGNGAIAVAISDDATTLTGWTNHTFGFRTAGVTLSNCSIEVTDVGRQFGAETGSWAVVSDGSTCVAGSTAEKNEY